MLSSAAPAVRADPGRVLEAANFVDPNRGLMPLSSSRSGLRFGYVAGEYQMAIADPNYDGIANLGGQTEYTNVAKALDVRLVSPTANRYAVIGLPLHQWRRLPPVVGPGRRYLRNQLV